MKKQSAPEESRFISAGNTFEFLPVKKPKREAKLSPDVSNNEKILVDLTNGTRKPQNAGEKELQDQIDAIKKAGRIVEIPDETY